MSYLVMECRRSYAVLLDQEGRFVKAANLRYDTTVTRGAGIGDDDTVVRTLLSAVTSKANLDCQRKLLQPSSFRLQLQTNS